MPTGVVKEIDLVRDVNLTVNSPLRLSAVNSDGLYELDLTEALVDHGVLAGLGDDDHTQYLLTTGARNVTGNQLFEAEIHLTDANTGLTASSGDLLYDVITGKSHIWRVNNSAEATLSANSLVFTQTAGSVGLDWATTLKLDVVVGGTAQVTFTDGTIEPVTNDDIDLGTPTLRFKKGEFSGLVTASVFASTVSTGTKPVAVASTTMCDSLNSDQVDGKDATDLLLVDGSQALSADWDAGSFDIRAASFVADVDAGGVSGTTSWVGGNSAIPGFGSIQGLGNAIVGTSHQVWVHIRVGTTLTYIPGWQA